MEKNVKYHLLTTLMNVPSQVFAVVDGAFFDDLRQRLKKFGLEGRALYLDEIREDSVAAGPHLVPLPDNAAVSRLLGAMEEKPAAVFWSWPAGAEALYKHLRKINMVEIPIATMDMDDLRFELVLFRHADPNVMAATSPVLYLDQYAQLLGDATGLVMVAPDHGGLRKVPRPKDLPVPAPSGFIRLDPSQMKALEGDRLAAFKRKLIRHLAAKHPDAFYALPAGSEPRLADAMVERAASHGLRKEQAVVLYARIEALFGFRFFGNPAHADLRGVLADRNLNEVMRSGMVLRIAADRASRSAARA